MPKTSAANAKDVCGNCQRHLWQLPLNVTALTPNVVTGVLRLLRKARNNNQIESRNTIRWLKSPSGTKNVPCRKRERRDYKRLVDTSKGRGISLTIVLTDTNHNITMECHGIHISICLTIFFTAHNKRPAIKSIGKLKGIRDIAI